MTIRTLLLFLVGHRESLLRVAAAPHAIWLSLLFVLSAGFAREYDGEYLLAEPWHLLIPLAAAFVSASLLFALMLLGCFAQAADRQPLAATYRNFLAMYWMTAPLAWLYAIPVERFTSAPVAMRLNLTLLAIVALWRVLLMTRVLSVMLRARWYDALLVVMLFADAVALQAIQLAPLPIIGMMGGIRHTPSERLLSDTACQVVLLGTCLLPVWLLGTPIMLLLRRLKPETRWRPQFVPSQPPRPISKPLWALAALALVGWTAVLPSTQREQALRWRVESAFAKGRISSALAVMSAHPTADFPPHYDPPPRIGYGQFEPPLMDVLLTALDEQAAPWVVRLYQERLEFHSNSHAGELGMSIDMMNDDRLEQFVTLLERIPLGTQIAERHSSQIIANLDHRSEYQPELTARRRQLLERLRALLPREEELHD